MTVMTEKLNSAMHLHQAGDLVAAQSAYEQILIVDADNVNALYLLGVLFYQQNKYDEALERLFTAVKLFPSADLYKVLGDIFFDKKDLDNSVNYYEKAIKLNPNFAEIFYNLGVISTLKNDPVKAIEYYLKSIEIKPDYKEAYFNLAHALKTNNDLDNAVLCYQKLLAVDPHDAEAYFNLGLALHSKKDLNKAILYYNESIKFDSENPNVHFSLGLAHFMLNDYDRAIMSFRQAILLKPDFADAYNNLGLCYYYKYDFEKSVLYYEKALEYKNDDIEIINNLGNAYKEKNEIANAVKCYKEAISIKPDYKEGLFNLGLIHLLKGEFEQGWEYFEYRTYVEKEAHQRSALRSKIDKNTAQNKTFYVHYEGGFGDTIQFSRFIPLLSSYGANVIFKPQKELEKLFKENYLKAKIISEEESNGLKFDKYLTVMSLPYFLNIHSENEIPLKKGYLSANKEKASAYKQKYFDNKSFKVGIIWQSKNIFFKDTLKHLPVSLFKDFAKLSGVELYSLQTGISNEEIINIQNEFKIVNIGETFKDFSDTAAALENLDLLITADTAAAHLAGAMNKPVWILLPFVPNWRWMLNREDTPWYSSAKLYRQNKSNVWDDVIDTMRYDLKDLLR